MKSDYNALSRGVTELDLYFRRTTLAAVLQQTLKAARVEAWGPVKTITQERDDKQKKDRILDKI